jgi:uncharacterized protein
MDVTPLIRQGQQVIQSYGRSGFKVNGQRYEQAIIVTAEETKLWTDKKHIADLQLDDFSVLFETKEPQDLYLLGTGETFTFPSADLLNSLKDKNIKPDIMDTGAACRTYNVLMAEGRYVTALLLPI